MTPRLLLLASLLWPAVLWAQVVITAEGLAPRIGQVVEMAVESSQLPLSSFEGWYGEPGGPQEVDLTVSPIWAEGLEMRTEVIDPAAAPGHEAYPEADYAYSLRLPGAMEGTYLFYQRAPEGDLFLGASGETSPVAGLSPGDTAADAPDPYPLTYGKEWGPTELPLQVPGDGTPAALTIQGEVDAWGTVAVPAGRFEALRMHQWGTAQLELQNPDGSTTSVTEVMDTYTWVSPGVGQVAAFQEITMRFGGADAPAPMTMTTVMRLQFYQEGETAVESRSWGAIKRERR